VATSNINNEIKEEARHLKISQVCRCHFHQNKQLTKRVGSPFKNIPSLKVSFSSKLYEYEYKRVLNSFLLEVV